MGEVFISYKQEERERMRPVAEGLRALGVDAWFDERLQPDRSFTEEIQEVMNGCRAQIVCWSPAAAASEWVRGEAEVARQRGVLVAVMVEPCALPPPFNMHHAENLSTWNGEGDHPGWRKVAEAVGRKLGRPGLGELAALAESGDAAAWKKWAQKYPNDLKADEAWAKAEELEIGAARARMGREREAAKRLAEEAAHRRAAAPVRPPPPMPAPPPRKNPAPLILGASAAVIVLGAAGAGAFYIMNPPSGAAPPAEMAESEAYAPPVAEAEAAPVQEAAAAQTPAVDPAAAAIAAMNRITERQWSQMRETDLVQLVVNRSSAASLRAAAEADARAQFLLGWAYSRGFNHLRHNAEEAERWLRRAAAQSNAGAQLELSRMFGRVPAAERGALARAAADQGNARAQVELGWRYLSGGPDYGVTINTEAGVRYYRLAADQGYGPGYEKLAELYESGRGVPRDDAEAVRLYRLAIAADNDLIISKTNLALLYLEGRGAPRDENAAARLLQEVEDDQTINVTASYHLGVLYEQGRGGLTANRDEAVRLYQSAQFHSRRAQPNSREGQVHTNARAALERLGETPR